MRQLSGATMTETSAFDPDKRRVTLEAYDPATMGEPSLWLRHVQRSHIEMRQVDDSSDEIQRQIEQVLALMMVRLKAGGSSVEEAKHTLICLAVNAALDLQRQHEPAAYVAMVGTLASFDPMLKPYREEVAAFISASERLRRSWLGLAACAGMLLAFGLGMMTQAYLVL
jgi:hypothetical protein